MKCHYCAEEIQDEAIVCRYCGRELLFAKSMLGKIASLESQISQLSAPLNALHKKTQAIDSEPSTTQAVTDAADRSDASNLKWLQAALWLIVLASVPFPALVAFLVEVFLLPLLPSSQPGELPRAVANVIGPFLYQLIVPILGGVAALIWHSRSLRWYVLLGVLLFSTSFGLRAILDQVPPVLGYQKALQQNYHNAVLVPFLFIFGALFVRFWQRKELAERVSTELKRGQITLALLLPTGLNFVFFVSIIVLSNHLSTTLVPYILGFIRDLVILSPLSLGFWAGLGWPGRHPKGYILLGLAAALPMLIILVIVEFMADDAGIPISVILPLSYVVVLTVILFYAGGLFADVLKNKTNSNLVSEHGFAQHVATKLVGPGKEPSRTTVLLLQSVAPLCTALIALVTAVVGFYRML